MGSRVRGGETPGGERKGNQRQKGSGGTRYMGVPRSRREHLRRGEGKKGKEVGGRGGEEGEGRERGRGAVRGGGVKK